LGPDVKSTLQAVLIVCLASRAALASGGADAYDDIDTAAAVDVHALADGYWLHNFDDPASGRNQLRAFDFTTGFALNYLRLTLAHRPGRVGFRLDAGIGNTADIFEQEDPAFAHHPHLARAGSYLGQAFFTAVAPVEQELRIDVGRFGTPLGLEDNESLQNWNYSRSLLYTWAEPSLHTGLRLTWVASNTIDAALYWVNGWDSFVLDGNDMRSVAGAVTWRPASSLDLTAVDMAGLEHPAVQLTGPLSFRNLLSASIVERATERLTFAGSFDYGLDRGAGGVDWWGVAAYAHADAWPWLGGSLRGEYLADASGFVTGTAQRVAEGTATIEVRQKLSRARAVGRLEYRHDRSSAHPFDGALPASRDAQDTITVAGMASF
jgi:hypothetical protein